MQTPSNKIKAGQAEGLRGLFVNMPEVDTAKGKKPEKMKNILSSNFALQFLIILGTIFSLSTDFISQSWTLIVGIIGFVGVARLEVKNFKIPTIERLKEINYLPYLLALVASLVEFFPMITGDVEKLQQAVQTGNWFAVASALFSIITIIVKTKKG